MFFIFKRTRTVHGGAVIPDDQVLGQPFMAIGELRLSGVLHQITKQQTPFGDGHLLDVLRVRGQVQRTAARAGQLANQRMNGPLESGTLFLCVLALGDVLHQRDVSRNRAAAAQREVLESFAATIGERPAFLHLNDSQHPYGSNKDRHALIGEGAIGVECFRWLLADPFSEGIPLILETPSELAEVADDDVSADPADVRMLRLLESLEAL